MASGGLWPIDDAGFNTMPKTFTEALPMVSLCLSIVASSWGMSKYFLASRHHILPQKGPAGGLLSIRFLGLIILNTMFAARLLCIESVFFSWYSLKEYPESKGYMEYAIWIPTEALISQPYMRIVIFFAPTVFPIIFNLITLARSSKQWKRLILSEPQILISPGFCPIIFRCVKAKSSHDQETPNVYVWKLASIINAIYLGVLPQILMIAAHYMRGLDDLTHGKFSSKGQPDLVSNSLILSEYGNVIFASVSSCIYLLFIAHFYTDKSIRFKENLESNETSPTEQMAMIQITK